MHAFRAGVKPSLAFYERLPSIGLRLAAAVFVERVFAAHAVLKAA
jgi:hypothetical protein